MLRFAEITPITRSLRKESRKESKWDGKISPVKCIFYTCVKKTCLYALLVSKFSILYLCLTSHIRVLPSCSFVSSVLNLFKQEHCAKAFCSPGKGVLFEEETHKIEQTLVNLEVKVSQWVTVDNGDLLYFLSQIGHLLTATPSKAADFWQIQLSI